METAPAHPDRCLRCGHEQPPGQHLCRRCGRPIYARPVGRHPRTWWPWTKWFLLHKVLHVEDTPHRIALGLAVGAFVTCTPTPGMQMAMTIVLAWMVGGNKFVGVPLAWVSNPVTMPPLFWLEYEVGRRMLGGGARSVSDFVRLVRAWDLHHLWTSFREVGGSLVGIFWQIFLGSLVIGGMAAVLTYAVSLWGVRAYRARHRRRFRRAGRQD
jgi:uncharacterized protein (DUF2062 family)